MDRPRVVSVVSKDAEERLPPDEAGVQVLESYVPADKQVTPQAEAQMPQSAQKVPIPASMSGQKPAGSVLGSLFSKIRSLFGR